MPVITKNTIFKILGLLILQVLFISCKKKAITDFSIDKSEYSAGESITIENKTKNVRTYRWTLRSSTGTVTKYSDVKPVIKLSPVAPDGEYSLTLTGATQKGAVSSTTRKFQVKTIRGYLYIYSHVSFTEPIEIKADGEKIATFHPGSEDLRIEIAEGQRNFTASNGKTISYTISDSGLYPWNITD